MSGALKVALAVPAKQKVSRDQYHEAPQLGLGYVAGGLLRGGIKPKIYNSKFDAIDEDTLTASLIDKAYDVVGFSAMTCEIDSVGRVAKRIKAADPKCRVMVGGPHTNAVPLETMRQFEAIDLVCIGEHEDHITELCHALVADDLDALAKFDHIVYRDGDELQYGTLSRRFIDDIDALPWPALHLFGNPEAYPVILSARGCPFGCKFCQRNSGRSLRMRDPIDVCDEIEHFTTMFDATRFAFRNESFSVNKKHTVATCKELIKRGLGDELTWSCETHASVVDEELLRLMWSAGCRYVEFGIESGEDGVLKDLSKGTNREMIFEAVATAKRVGLGVGGLFILGHPNETKRTMLETIRFAAKLNPDGIAFSRMTPFPGTEVYRYAKAHERGLRLLSEDWEKYDNLGGSPMAWDNFSTRTLMSLQLGGVLYYYVRNRRWPELGRFLFVQKNWRFLARSLLRPAARSELPPTKPDRLGVL